jgi:hypothetical protein
MIGNYMWDPRTNKSFDIGVNRDSLMPLWWNGSEPLWITLMKARRKVYMYYWPGECADLQASPPSGALLPNLKHVTFVFRRLTSSA